MRLKSVFKDCNYVADYERHEGVFVGKAGREFRFFFLVPKSYSSFVSDRDDHWFILGATSAALIGEDYSQDKPVSALLKRHIECLILQWKDWFPSKKEIRVDAPVLDNTSDDPVGEGKLSGLYFTGGVDSTFSLTRQFDRTDILVRAIFDWDSEADLLRELRALSDTKFGKPMLSVGTNVLRAFSEFEDAWAYRTHGPALGALAHLFSKELGHIVFSSSRMYGTLIPWGSHPLTDPLLSSDAIGFEHYGTEFSRFDKIMAIAGKPEFLPQLEVCGQVPSVKGHRLNCSSCSKCLRTMIALEISGTPKEAAASFDWSSFGAERIARMRLYHPNEYAIFRELMRDAEARGFSEIAGAISIAIRKSYKYYPLGAVEGFLRRRYPTFIALWPVLKGAKHTLLKPNEARS